MKKLFALLAVIVLASLGLAACGGGDDEDETTAAATTETTATATGGGGGGATVDLSAPANGAFSFDQTDLTAAAGPITVNFDNPSPVGHDVVIEDSTGKQLGKTEVTSQGNASTTVDLQPGTYTYFCDVDGHRDAGMEGTLTVN